MTKSIRSLALLLLVFCISGLIGCGQREERAKTVWLYDFRGAKQIPFGDAIIYEKSPGYIKFKSPNFDSVIEHSGRYTVEN